jgi:hypothetical protein
MFAFVATPLSFAIARRYLFSANGAGSFEPGATPQELMHLKSSAESAIHAVHAQEGIRREVSGALNRAFSA